jgi:hypothetical protein
MRELLILICCAVVSGAAPQSIRDVDWKNFSYPLLETDGVPGDGNCHTCQCMTSVLAENVSP